ncbi:hypothetical protein [Halopiger thermotolerans]
MGEYISEKYQLGIITPFLREEGWEFTTEAKLYAVRVDIVGFNGEDTIAIELKSKDFKRGRKQAERNCSFVDYSYLAMWKENIPKDAVERLEDSDIGLLEIDTEVKRLSPASESNPSDYAKTRVKDIIHDQI